MGKEIGPKSTYLFTPNGPTLFPPEYRAADEAPHAPLPKFSFQEQDKVCLRPYSLAMPDEDFIEIANQFAFMFRTYFETIYRPAALDDLQNRRDGMTPFLNLHEWIRNFLATYPSIRDQYLNEVGANPNWRDETAREKSSEYLNCLLATAGIFLKPTMRGYTFDLYDVTSIESGSAEIDDITARAPIIHIGNERMPDWAYRSKTNGTSAQAFHNLVPYIMVSDSLILAILGKNGLAERTMNNPNEPQAVLRKTISSDGLSVKHDNEIVEDTMHHEITHILIHNLFSKATAADNIYRKKFPLAASSVIFDTVIEIKDDYSPLQCNELAAYGAAIANYHNNPQIKLYNHHSQNPREADRLFVDILMQMAFSVPGISTTAKGNITWNQGQVPYVKGAWEHIMSDSAMMGENIRTIGKKMWELGYELLRQTEAELS